ncbi:MAG: bifunctional oligoribonuclease/PAP phosphatase NrnA [Synergistaceae bacterium]|nr:bifunctional oligoribonuclease/PAP phosphatase NrnA [Synergistaceae bacterium]
MTNDELLRASDMLRANHSWHIFTHRKADGDAVGSANALFEAGISAGHSVKWSSPDAKLPIGYNYLPCFSEHTTIETLDFPDDGTLYVFLDCANQTRSVSGFPQTGSTNSLNIDHHEDNSHYAQVNCVDGKASSTCELLFRILKAGEWPLSRSIAESLYTGLFTDTGSFTFSNTSPLTHNIAAELIELGAEPGHMTDLITQNKTVCGMALWGRALSRIEMFGEENKFALTRLYAEDFRETGADMTETEGLPAMLMSIRGLKFAVTLTEYPNGTKRLSFRSREGSPFGAGEIAREFGGGGHERAAGASFEGSVDEACAKMREYLLEKSR